MGESIGIYSHIVEILVATVVIVLGVIVGLGKGDFLISGYNTASKAKRESFNIIRLRILTMSVCILVGILLIISVFVPSFYPIMSAIIIATAIADVVLMKSSVYDVSKAIRLSRRTLTNIHENLLLKIQYLEILYHTFT